MKRFPPQNETDRVFSFLVSLPCNGKKKKNLLLLLPSSVTLSLTHMLSVSPAADQAAGAASSQGQRGRDGAGAESTTQEQLQGAAQRGEPGPLGRPPSGGGRGRWRVCLHFCRAKSGPECRDPEVGRRENRQASAEAADQRAGGEEALQVHSDHLINPLCAHRGVGGRRGGGTGSGRGWGGLGRLAA